MRAEKKIEENQVVQTPSEGFCWSRFNSEEIDLLQHFKDHESGPESGVSVGAQCPMQWEAMLDKGVLQEEEKSMTGQAEGSEGLDRGKVESSNQSRHHPCGHKPSNASGSRSWKRQGTESPPGPQSEYCPTWTLISDFWSPARPEHKLWSLVTQDVLICHSAHRKLRDLGHRQWLLW